MSISISISISFSVFVYESAAGWSSSATVLSDQRPARGRDLRGLCCALLLTVVLCCSVLELEFKPAVTFDLLGKVGCSFNTLHLHRQAPGKKTLQKVQLGIMGCH